MNCIFLPNPKINERYFYECLDDLEANDCAGALIPLRGDEDGKRFDYLFLALASDRVIFYVDQGITPLVRWLQDRLDQSGQKTVVEYRRARSRGNSLEWPRRTSR